MMEEDRQNEQIRFMAPLFIVFADYLGYVSEYIDVAQEWCEGKPPKEEEVRQFLSIEAMCIYRAMLKDYTITEVREWYEIYSPIFLEEYYDTLKELEKSEKDDLPF